MCPCLRIKSFMSSFKWSEKKYHGKKNLTFKWQARWMNENITQMKSKLSFVLASMIRKWCTRPHRGSSLKCLSLQTLRFATQIKTWREVGYVMGGAPYKERATQGLMGMHTARPSFCWLPECWWWAGRWGEDIKRLWSHSTLWVAREMTSSEIWPLFYPATRFFLTENKLKRCDLAEGLPRKWGTPCHRQRSLFVPFEKLPLCSD